MKRSQPKRDWSLTHDKVAEGCRVCGKTAERAHIIARAHDKTLPVFADPDSWKPYTVHPDRICPLCPEHHRQYDRHELSLISLLPHLSMDEQIQAVADAGGIELARNRLIGRQS